MAPIMVAALFWKRSTKWGALAAALFTAACLLYFAVLQNSRHPGDVIWRLGHGTTALKLLFINPRGDVSFWNGFMTVVPMVFGSAFCMIAGSLLTKAPSRATLDKYFPRAESQPASRAAGAGEKPMKPEPVPVYNNA
jgi:Na+/proline symporter